MDQNVFDIAVVGAGPAGSIAAYAAAERGLKVALIDRQTFLRDKPCGDGIGPEAVRIMRRLGLDEIFDGRTPIQAVTIFGPTGMRSKSAVPNIGGKATHGYVIPRVEFDNHLFRRAIKAGAEDFSGKRYLSMSDAGDARVIELRDLDGTCQTMVARLVIGADGAYSAVRKSLSEFNKRPTAKQKYMGLAMRAYAESDDFQPGGEIGPSIVFEFDREILPSYGWVFPIGEGKVNIGVGGPLIELQRRGVGLKQLLTSFTSRLMERGIEIDKIHGQRAHHLPSVAGMPPLAYKRAALIGDAASMINPTSGEGIGYAVTAAVQLVDLLPPKLDNGRALSAALAQFEHRFRRRYRMHFLSSRLTIKLLQRPMWSTMLVNAMQEDPRILSDAVDMLFGFGTLHSSTAYRVFRASLKV